MRSSRTWAMLAGLLLVSVLACDGPLVPESPPPAMVGYSASPFAIDVEFDRSLDRTSIADPLHYAVTDSAGARSIPFRVTLVDTLFGRTVRLLFRLGTLTDSTHYRLTVAGVRDAWGQPLFAADSASVEVVTGLWYSRPIRALLERKCTPCHAGGRAGGNYRTDSYAELFGAGSDAASDDPRPNLIAGDARCLLVIRTSPGHSMFNVAHLSYAESQLITNWVVTYQARK